MCSICQLPGAHEEIIYTANYLKNIYALNYIDPGSGYVLTSNLTGILGILIGALASLFFFFRNRIFPFLTKKWIIALVLLGVVIFAGIMFFMPHSSTNSSKKAVILGFDGMDPQILSDGFKKGLFPNLKKLSDTGYFSKLSSTVPPQSPVAWASFMTGESPAKHSIYDFIERNPNDYSLNLVFSDQDLNRENRIKTPPFWEEANKKGISTTVLFLPDTFEPPKSLSGELISGMGVPDILGTQGTFTLFTTKSYPTEEYTWRGKVIPVETSSTIKTNIEGPKFSSLGKTDVSKIPLDIKTQGKDEIEVKVQGKTFKLKKGQFSDWVRLEFKLDFFTKVKGIAKFYLKSVSPDFELYLSPINFDPDTPLKPISSPKEFSSKLSHEHGLFSTLGLPHDTWALEEDVFDEKAFLTQAESILLERRKIYYSKLNSYKDGIIFAYFGMPDTISHMFWRLKDQKGQYGNTIYEYYKKMDDIVGQTMKKIDKDTSLFILSDHGFWSFDYEMNINNWLLDNGYLVLKEEKSGPLYENVDWSKTKAYAAGYNSVFLNIKGREKEGIVNKKDANKVQKEIIDKLIEYENPENGEKVMKHVYTRKEMGVKDSDLYAPDMILGFYKGTRASWDSAVGAITDYTIRKREGKWSGDHLFDPTEVPGVLLSNKKINIKSPNITQIIPLIFEKR